MAGSTYKYEFQTETVGLGPDGRPTEGVKVGFVTSAGVHFTVFIPKAQFNANKVKAAADEQYAHIEAVHKIGG